MEHVQGHIVEGHAVLDTSVPPTTSARLVEDFTPTFTLHRSEPDAPGRYPRANWDATPEDPERWPPDCAQAFREAVTRNRGKYDIDWRAP